jgi:hypothetical protein
MSNLSNERQVRLAKSLRQMLDTLSKATPRKLYCEDCGSCLTYINSHFWFEDTDQSWQIPLPYCRVCNPEFRGHASFPA